jgi:hypothetical protein
MSESYLAALAVVNEMLVLSEQYARCSAFLKKLTDWLMQKRNALSGLEPKLSLGRRWKFSNFSPQLLS